ncbi:hypothetical protein Tco_1343288 [Tanacetum coccineum]
MSPQSSLPPQVKELSEYSKEDQSDDKEVDWIYSDEDDEKKDDVDDDKSIDLEMTNDEETKDEFVHSDEQVNDDEDEEMMNAEVKESGNGDEEYTDKAKTDAEKTEEVKDDAKKAELPPTSSSLSDTTDAKINSLLDIKIQSEVPHIQSPSVLTIPVSVISEPSILTSTLETPSVAHATTLLPPLSVSTIPPVPHQTTSLIPTPPITINAATITTVVPESNALTDVQLRVEKLEKDVSELKKIDHSAEALATLKSQVLTIVEHYLGSKIGDDLQKKPTIDLEQESEKSASEIRKIKREQAEKQKMPKYTIKSTDKAPLKEYDQKSALYQTMQENKSFNRNPTNHALYHALIEALIEDENAMDKGVADTVKNHKRQPDDDDDDPSAGLNQGKKTKRKRTKESKSSKKPSTTKGKAPSKRSKTVKSTTAKEPIEEPTTEVDIDDAINTAAEDVVHDANQPHDDSTQAKDKAPMQD